MKKTPFNRIVLTSISLLLILVSACQPKEPQPTQLPSAEATETPAPTPEPTEIPLKSLSICVGNEPETLYLYGGNSREMWSVLEAIYDGPVDTVNFSPLPVILDKIPSLEDGDVTIEAVNVSVGQPIVDANDTVTVLLKGTSFLPSGCGNKNCAQTWDGSSEVVVDQQKIRFRLLEGLTWSDGESLTVQDSVYSFQLASDPKTPVNPYYTDRTASYTALNELEVEWQGLPGYTTRNTSDPFWLPLPEHVLGELSAEEVLSAEAATRKPIGWGAYQLESWEAGKEIVLVKNPNYFRAAEGLPKFDRLRFVFLGPNADSNLKALEVNECDLVDSSVELNQQLIDIVEKSNLGEFSAYFAQGPEWEHLDFGIVPASYDDGYQAGIDRPDWFSDVRMRTAIASCIDREGIANLHFVNRSAVPASYYAPSHPAFNDQLTVIPYDVDAGIALLEEMGWRDEDNDPKTARTAYGVTGVRNGTVLILNYATTQSDLRMAISKEIAASLGKCGIEVQVNNMIPSEFYAPGPDGLLFGRNFDLAQFTWDVGRSNPCFLYMTNEIPNKDNFWTGANITGYSNAEYDHACLLAQASRKNDKEGQAESQRIFNEMMPVLPLYYQLKVAVSRVDFCGFEALDVSARSALYGLEGFGYGEMCGE